VSPEKDAKMAEPIEMLFVEQTGVVARDPCIRWRRVWTTTGENDWTICALWRWGLFLPLAHYLCTCNNLFQNLLSHKIHE